MKVTLLVDIDEDHVSVTGWKYNGGTPMPPVTNSDYITCYDDATNAVMEVVTTVMRKIEHNINF